MFPFHYDVSKFFFLKTMRCYCTSEGCNAQAAYPQGCKILVGFEIAPVVLMPWIRTYISQFCFWLFWPRQILFTVLLFYYFDPGKWRSEKSRHWNRCARAFHCLEIWNILKMIKVLHSEIFRPTGLFKNWLWRHNLSFLSFNAVTKCLKKLPFSSEPTLLAGAQVTFWLWPLQKVVSFHNPFALKTWTFLVRRRTCLCI